MNTILNGICQSNYSKDVKQLLLQKVMSTNNLQKIDDCQQICDVALDWLRKTDLIAISLGQTLIGQISTKNPNFFLDKFSSAWFLQLAREISDFVDEPKVRRIEI
jgi:hypothetical protein